MNIVTKNQTPASRIILGWMRMAKCSAEELEQLVEASLQAGINFFDHADIYGKIESERLFGEVLKKHPKYRDQMIVQTKCGIRPGFYDNSCAHIIASVDASLKRLQTGWLDVLLLHRPDALMDGDEIGKAFNQLKKEGKVRYFGVSNMNTGQMEYLQSRLEEPLLFNQLQFSLVHSSMIDAGIHVNMKTDFGIDRDNQILYHCMKNRITIQAWSVLQASWEEGTFLDHPSYPLLNEVLERLAGHYQVTKSAVALNWILRHPAGMQAIIGTTKTEHINDLAQATTFELTRPEWYELYQSVGKKLP